MTRSVLLLMCCFFLLTLAAFPATSVGSEQLRINTSIKPPFSTEEQDGFFDLLLKEVFGRLGVSSELIRLPAERALKMADEGICDGDLPRIAGLSSTYTNLVQVPEPIIDYNFVAFSHAQSCRNVSWDDMRGREVGLIIGWKIYEENIPPEARISRMKSPEQLFAALEAKRFDLALYERHAGHHLIRKENFTIVECQPPLAVQPMYLYLNKRHSVLVDAVADELRRMKDDGALDRIVAATLGG